MGCLEVMTYFGFKQPVKKFKILELATGATRLLTRGIGLAKARVRVLCWNFEDDMTSDVTYMLE